MDYTREQILQHVLALDPISALSLKNGNRLNAVRTQVYESVIVQGVLIHLNRGDGGRYIAIYIRVSITAQAEDGFSDKEQAEALIDSCIRDGKAFAVFSDVKLSGGLPWDSPELIQEFRASEVEMYDTVYRLVFLSKTDQETPENLERMNVYLATHLKLIKNGGYSKLFDLLPGEAAPKGKDRKPTWHRPALTAIVVTLDNICEIKVTDLSRLSRSELLMADLLPRFRKKDVTVMGLYQDLSFLNKKDDLGAAILREVYIHMAAKTRFDILLGVLRGMRQRLVQGIYNSKPPDWIERVGDEKNGKAIFNEEQRRIALRLIKLYLDGDGNSEGSVTSAINTVNAEGCRNRFGTLFTVQGVGNMLDNPALIGHQEIFGKWWPVFPVLIDEATWKRIRDKRERRGADHKRRKATGKVNDHLMVGLLKCSCGYSMVAEGFRNNATYYACRNPVSFKGHSRLSHPQVDAWFDALMSRYSEQVIDYVASHSDGVALMEELRDLEKATLRNVTIRAEEKAYRREALVPAVTGLLPGGTSDPDFEDTINRILASKTRDLAETEREEQERIATMRGRLRDIRHVEEFAALKTVAQDWADLSVPRRNAILKDIFKYIQMEGAAPHETLNPVFKVPQEFEVRPIEIEVKRHGTSYIRTLQDMGQWFHDMTRPESEGILEEGTYPGEEEQDLPFDQSRRRRPSPARNSRKT